MVSRRALSLFLRRSHAQAALTGFIFSTSVLSRTALGDLASDFEEDIRGEMLACAPAGRLWQVIDFGYELARRPG